MFTKTFAHELLSKHVQDTYQVLHANMVASVLEAYASKFSEPADLWYSTGLLHDLDYDEFPDEHPKQAIEWLKDLGAPNEMLHAISAHAPAVTGVSAVSLLDFALLATDELCGFLYAYSKMRPTGFVGMKASKVVKKLKDPTFASKISREDIANGVAGLPLDLSEHISFVVDVLNSLELGEN